MDDLLFLSQRIPYPPDKGDKIRSFHILKRLTARHRVHLGCFVDNEDDLVHVAKLREYCANLLALPLTSQMKLRRSTLAIAKGTSFSEECFRDGRMMAWVTDTIAKQNISKAFVFCSAMAPYVMSRDIRKILDIVDVDSEKWAAYAKMSAWPMRAIYNREARKVLDLERRAALAFDRSIFVSQAEALAFLRLAPEASDRVLYVSNGVDTEYFDPSLNFKSPFSSGTKSAVFTGTMNYRPNVEAVVHFAHDIWPAVHSVHADAEFWIVGATPAPEVQELTSIAGVRVTGQVPDIRPYLANAQCAVAPLSIGRGVQNKVLEAMAMTRPVVASPEAFEGISAVPGEELLIAETAKMFSDQICSVFAGAYPHLGARARQRIESDYRWTANLDKLDAIFDGLNFPENSI